MGPLFMTLWVCIVATGSVCNFNNLSGGFYMTAGTEHLTDLTPGTQGPDQDESGFLSRRKVFAAGSAGALAVCLAACGGGSSSSDSSDGAVAAPNDPASAGSDGATATATADPGGAAVPAASLTKLSAVPVGGSIKVTFGGKPVIVSQPTKGTAAAFSAVCPHQGGIVAPKGKLLKCPLHGSTFADATGKNLSGPAAGKPLTAIPVDVVKGNVVLKA
jgi:cytochrome b6-f complex iron-sulfur subunit